MGPYWGRPPPKDGDSINLQKPNFLFVDLSLTQEGIDSFYEELCSRFDKETVHKAIEWQFDGEPSPHLCQCHCVLRWHSSASVNPMDEHSDGGGSH